MYGLGAHDCRLQLTGPRGELCPPIAQMSRTSNGQEARAIGDDGVGEGLVADGSGAGLAACLVLLRPGVERRGGYHLRQNPQTETRE